MKKLWKEEKNKDTYLEEKIKSRKDLIEAEQDLKKKEKEKEKKEREFNYKQYQKRN